MFQVTRLSDYLSYPLPDRIRVYTNIIETASIKDLQAFFPSLVQSIFGDAQDSSFNFNVGWGLRTITEKGENQMFRTLYDFFAPTHGSFFRLIYRLLKDNNVKYEFKLSEIPQKLRQTIEAGRNVGFYTNLLDMSLGPRNLSSLSLNAFDFYMFSFVIHGLKNLQKVSQAALNVNNENLKTVYFNLTADYLCYFLPSDPNSQIYPQIDLFKSHSSMPTMPTMSPTKPPKYLMLSALSHQTQSPTNARADLRLPDARLSNWRSESVMMIFIDCWLKTDLDETWELPGNEFIRMIRILVKQLHFFSNVAEQDLSSLGVLRQQAQSMLNMRMYPFLKTIIARWPLDTSFLNVLELFLSYLQPWRYVFNRNIQNLNSDMLEIPHRFKAFIHENIHIYTQIFVKLIPRFLKMEISSSKNCYMLFRMLKVFRQPSIIIRDIEKNMMCNDNLIRSHNSASFNDSIHSSTPRSNSFNRSADRFSPHPHHRSHNQALEDSSYVYMFSNEVKLQIYELMQRLYVARMKAEREVEKMSKEMAKHTSMWESFLQLIGWLSSLNLSFSLDLEDKKKSISFLDLCLDISGTVFNIPIEFEGLIEDNDDERDVSANTSEFLNITPSFMKSQMRNISYTGDPFLLPIMSTEVKFLVRFLHQISSKLNIVFEDEFEELWKRHDLIGRFCRQILSEPVEARFFDKSAGYSELKVHYLGPRLSLRKLASFKILLLLAFSFAFGRIFLGASSLGLITIAIILLGYLFLKAIISK